MQPNRIGDAHITPERRIPIYFLGYKHFMVSPTTATLKNYLFPQQLLKFYDFLNIIST